MIKNTKRAAIELISHEGAVLETYKDSVGVWTWGIGITNNSGHNIDRYRHNPQPLEKVLEVYLWALQKYEDRVIKAFHPIKLNEHQLAAATSFDYNTGGIFKASWVKKFKAGDITGAKKSFMAWKKPKEIIPRREKERDLFFDGKWSGNGKIAVYGVYKNGNVNWGSRKIVDAKPALDAIWGDKTPQKQPQKPVQEISEDSGTNLPESKEPSVKPSNPFIKLLINIFKTIFGGK